MVRSVNLDGSVGGPEQQVSELSIDNENPLVALDDRGTGIAVANFLPSEGSDNAAEAQLLGPGAGPIGDLTPLGGPADSRGPTIAGDPATGVATVLSALLTDGKETLVARRFLEPPTCSDVHREVADDQPTVVSLSCTGIALTGFQAVTQPAHGELAPVPGDPLSVQYTPEPGYHGRDSFDYQGLNDGGGSASATVHIHVGDDGREAPVVTRFSLRRGRGAGASGDLAKRRVLYSFHLGYSQPSTAKVRIERPVRGVRRGKRCRVRRRGSSGRPCTLYKRVVVLSSHTLAPSATLPVSSRQLARLVRLHRLRASAVATDAAGNASKARLLHVRFKD
jgi:hypothetical protein